MTGRVPGEYWLGRAADEAARENDVMVEQLRISAKNLGSLALADACDRCFWLQLRVGFKMPYQIFPGIFSSIDSYTKVMVEGWMDRHGSPPAWLSALGEIAGYEPPPHYSRFQILDPATRILLTGTPDAVFRRPDGSCVIADYKTARYTAGQDTLLPMYAAQLNAYRRIGKERGLSPISELALIYFEPVTAEAREENYTPDGFGMEFSAHVERVEIDERLVDRLLGEARRIGDLKTAPEGRAGCKECEAMGKVVGAIRLSH